jgi:hypothetical protein
MMTRRWRAGPILIGLALTTACTTISPDELGATPTRVEAAGLGRVNVVPILVSKSSARFNSSGRAQEIDLNEYSEMFADLIAASLRESGAELGDDGRTLGVRVIWMDHLFHGPCLLDYTAYFGTEQRAGFQAKGLGQSAQSSCKLAFEAAVTQLLGEALTRDYLGAGR